MTAINNDGATTDCSKLPGIECDNRMECGICLNKIAQEECDTINNYDELKPCNQHIQLRSN